MAELRAWQTVSLPLGLSWAETGLFQGSGYAYNGSKTFLQGINQGWQKPVFFQFFFKPTQRVFCAFGGQFTTIPIIKTYFFKIKK